MLDTPILFIIYNRPDVTEKVFEKIREIKPKKIYVVADGPKDKYDHKLCLQTRDKIKIDWKCDKKYLFREKNLGCKLNVSGAISWVLVKEKKIIILEDDTLPNLTFFPFCEELLEKYENNKQIFSITGVNWQNGRKRGKGSYYFSCYPGIWGWATWRDRWEKFDVNLSDLEKRVQTKFLDYLTDLEEEKRFHLNNLFKTKNKEIDSWGFGWHFTFYKNKAFCVVPNFNLISNIGFDNRATHTKQSNSWKANQSTEKIKFPLIHPKKIIRNEQADHYLAKRNFLHKFSFFEKVISKINRIMNDL